MKYEHLNFELIYFETEDVILTSSDGDALDWQ